MPRLISWRPISRNTDAVVLKDSTSGQQLSRDLEDSYLKTHRGGDRTCNPRTQETGVGGFKVKACLCFTVTWRRKRGRRRGRE